MLNRGATNTALRRAREYYGVEMPDRMWAELAESLARDEHRFLGGDGRGQKRYAVQLLRDDSTTITMVVIFEPVGKSIVTVFAPAARGKEYRKPRRKGKRRARNRDATDRSVDPNRDG